MAIEQDFKYGRELAKLMEDAGQVVPPELRNCGPGTGGGGRSRYGPSGGEPGRRPLNFACRTDCSSFVVDSQGTSSAHVTAPRSMIRT